MDLACGVALRHDLLGVCAHVIAARQKEPLVIFGFFTAMGFFNFL